jgi:hypothetical protein
MLNRFGISGLLLSFLIALAPPAASAHDHDHGRRAWERHERHERHEWREHEHWERRHGYRYGYYDGAATPLRWHSPGDPPLDDPAYGANVSVESARLRDELSRSQRQCTRSFPSV